MELGELKQDLHYYCHDLAHNEEREKAFLARVEEFEKTGLTLDEATRAAQREGLSLACEPHLHIDPEELLFEEANEIVEGESVDEYMDALKAARDLYPDVAALADLYRDNLDLFQEACRRVGRLVGGERFEEDHVINLILEEAEELSKTLEVS